MKRSYSKFTDEEIIDAIEQTPNFTQAATLLGINRKTVQRVAWERDIESKNERLPRDHSKVLRIINKRNGNIRVYLRTHGLLEEVCAWCGISDEYNGKPIVLQIDHINGIPADNRLENLRWLCPNCHSQTPTFTNRKREVSE